MPAFPSFGRWVCSNSNKKKGLLKTILQSVYEDVSGGATLSDAMAKHPKAFDKLYAKMIAAGEVGGVLDLILQRLADFLEKAARLKRKIIGAMIYPMVVLSVAALIVLGIMYFIVPNSRKSLTILIRNCPHSQPA